MAECMSVCCSSLSTSERSKQASTYMRSVLRAAVHITGLPFFSQQDIP